MYRLPGGQFLEVMMKDRLDDLNVGSGRGTSLNELIALMTKVTGEQPEVEYHPGRIVDVATNVLDVTRVREELEAIDRPRLIHDGSAP
jgi:UDP-glucose 4-epimerase